MSAAARVVAEALAWLGTPYHHHARIKGVGVDCAQLLCAVYEAAGLVPPIDTGHYAIDWHLHHGDELFAVWMQRYATRAPYAPGDTLMPGDAYLFRFGGRVHSHGAIAVSASQVVHAVQGSGVQLSTLAEEPLASCARSAQRWTISEVLA